MKVTVLGSGGFIGRYLAAWLTANGYECWLPRRDDTDLVLRPLGIVYYCIGLTADFRSRPYETVDAHVGVLRNLLEQGDFEQLIYLSSTRVYAGCDRGEEGEILRVETSRRDDLYNLSKLMGESLALHCGKPCRIARLSNVLGPGMGSTNFVGSLVAEAKATGSVRLKTALASSKDYVWIDDVVAGLIAIAEHGRMSIYNLAGGVNVSHSELADLFTARGIQVSVAENSPTICFPPISVARLANDAGFRPKPVQPLLADWLNQALAY